MSRLRAIDGWFIPARLRRSDHRPLPRSEAIVRATTSATPRESGTGGSASFGNVGMWEAANVMNALDCQWTPSEKGGGAATGLGLVKRENRSAHSPSRRSNGTHLCDKLHLSQIMRLTIAVLIFLILGVTSCIHADRSNSTAETSDAVTRKLFIDPSSTARPPGES